MTGKRIKSIDKRYLILAQSAWNAVTFIISGLILSRVWESGSVLKMKQTRSEGRMWTDSPVTWMRTPGRNRSKENSTLTHVKYVYTETSLILVLIWGLFSSAAVRCAALTSQGTWLCRYACAGTILCLKNKHKKWSWLLILKNKKSRSVFSRSQQPAENENSARRWGERRTQSQDATQLYDTERRRVSLVRDDQRHGVSGGIRIKVEALEWTDRRTKVPLHRSR